MDRGTVLNSPSGKFVASKAFTLAGVIYQPGERVDVERLAEYKIGQLLNQRFLRPAPPDNTTDT